MTLEVVGARPAFSEEPLAGSTADRLARLPAIVEELRRHDAAAERDRVLQYGAVERLRHAGLLSLRVPAATADPAAARAMWSASSSRSHAAVLMWRKHFDRITDSPNVC